MQFLLRGFICRITDVAIVVSTLAIAALFQPLRHRILAIIDRRFYRHKYDAAKIFAAFSTTLRHEVDLNTIARTSHHGRAGNDAAQSCLALVTQEREREKTKHAAVTKQMKAAPTISGNALERKYPMMGSKERHFAPLINVSLEELVPQDHFYRHLERTLDLSFVREFVQKTYATRWSSLH